MTIPFAAKLPGDLADVLDKGDAEKKEPRRVIRMHASDARHAVATDPERYSFVEHKLDHPNHHSHGYGTWWVVNGLRGPRGVGEPAAEPVEPGED